MPKTQVSKKKVEAVKQLRTRSIFYRFIVLMVLSVLFELSCTKQTGEPTSPAITTVNLKNIADFPLEVKEPSGLCQAWNTNEFLVVSDHSNTVFRISNTGETIEELVFTGQDLEGVGYQEAGKIIWVVDEKQNKLFKLNKKGEEELEYSLSYQAHPSNKGLEAVTVNTKNNHIFMLNEALPGLLLEFFDGDIIRSTNLDFAKDYSGLFYEVKNNELWIASDESQSIYQCSIDGKLIKIYRHNLNKIEGLVVDIDKMEFWVCSDSEEKLYLLKAQ
jgi:uncharacterized protein YjiK